MFESRDNSRGYNPNSRIHSYSSPRRQDQAHSQVDLIERAKLKQEMAKRARTKAETQEKSLGSPAGSQVFKKAADPRSTSNNTNMEEVRGLYKKTESNSQKDTPSPSLPHYIERHTVPVQKNQPTLGGSNPFRFKEQDSQMSITALGQLLSSKKTILSSLKSQLQDIEQSMMEEKQIFDQKYRDVDAHIESITSAHDDHVRELNRKIIQQRQLYETMFKGLMAEQESGKKIDSNISVSVVHAGRFGEERNSKERVKRVPRLEREA